MTYKYSDDISQAVLANANRGGENVHSGIVMGALLGAAQGASGIPAALKGGLRDSAKLQSEIDAFVAAVVPDGM